MTIAVDMGCKATKTKQNKTYRDEEDQMKNEGAREVTTLYCFILDAQGQLTL